MAPLGETPTDTGGDKNMKPHEIKVAVVAQMWSDGIWVDTQWAEMASVARHIDAGAGAVRDEISTYMVKNDDCPVVKTSRNEVALVRDPEWVREFILRHGGEDDLPGDLRDL